METGQAFGMGWQSASSGFFFDGLELLAALAPAAGGIEKLEPALHLLFPERDRINAQMDALAALASAAYRTPIATPRTVDAYRALLEERVFDIVNRWSYIRDIHTVNRLQAWFYTGFGLGRAETVHRGVMLMQRAYALVGGVPPLPSTPTRLERMGREAARQLEIAAGEDDLSSVRPLFLGAATRIEALADRCTGPLAEVVEREDLLDPDDLALYLDIQRRVDLDFARRALHSSQGPS